jgi:hypothetical protein
VRVTTPKCLGWLAAAMTTTWVATADAQETDGSYGRLDGDLELALGPGVAFAEGGPAFALRGSVVYLWTAGVYATYTEAFGAEAPHVERSIATGLHFRPLFLGRFASNRETGPAHADLTLDSLFLEIGPVWDSPRTEGMGGRPGLELGLGLSVPILPAASGPFVGIRGALRYRDRDLRGRSSDDVVERGALLTLTLSWHQIVGAHLVDAGDVNPR